MVCIDPAMCVCLMIVVVCVRRLGEEYLHVGAVGVYVGGCPGKVMGKRDMFSAVIICIMD